MTLFLVQSVPRWPSREGRLTLVGVRQWGAPHLRAAASPDRGGDAAYSVAKGSADALPTIRHCCQLIESRKV